MDVVLVFLDILLSMWAYDQELMCLTGSDWISAYPTTLKTSGCVRLLDWSRRRLMPTMSYRNPCHASCSAVMPAAAIKGSR